MVLCKIEFRSKTTFYSTSNKFIQWIICSTWPSNIFPYWIQKRPYFFFASALYHCFSTIKAVDRKKNPNEKNTTSSKRNVKLTIWNIYGIVFKRLKSHASFIRCRIKRLLDVLLYNTGIYLDEYTAWKVILDEPLDHLIIIRWSDRHLLTIKCLFDIKKIHAYVYPYLQSNIV